MFSAWAARFDRAGLTYFVPGISRLEPTVVSHWLSARGLPLSRMVVLDQTPSALQIIGVLLVIGSIWLG